VTPSPTSTPPSSIGRGGDDGAGDRAKKAPRPIASRGPPEADSDAGIDKDATARGSTDVRAREVMSMICYPQSFHAPLPRQVEPGGRPLSDDDLERLRELARSHETREETQAVA